MKIKELLEKQTVQKLFLCFWMYSVLGWLYEVFLEVVVYKWGFTNVGIMYGPYCPIYGVGALLFLLNNDAAGFITGVVLPVDGGFSAYSGV